MPYYYQGYCPQTGQLLKLPRTPFAETLAQELMQQLAQQAESFQDGKMYGILLVERPDGTQEVLKAFSGLLKGQSHVEGWVPPIPGRDQVALAEAQTLTALNTIKQELLHLQFLPERQQYKTLSASFEQQWQQMQQRHQTAKQSRSHQREKLSQTLAGDDLTKALEVLDAESRHQSTERRHFKRQQQQALQPLQQVIDAADRRIGELKQQRKTLSRQLQTQMHAAYSLTNFSGQTVSLQALMAGGGMPTGTGDCCAPKLLHYAATQGLKPLAMAEFWWGPASLNQDKIPGQFYGACTERCQPLMGFLLSGLSVPVGNVAEGQGGELPIVYEDEWLIAIDKPAGLLSVPGRYLTTQDSVLSRLRHLLPDGEALRPVHRLDRETSGLLLFARDPDTHRHLSHQFQQRQVYKVYEAVLAGVVEQEAGVIQLPLWGDPENRPYQTVDLQRGKYSETHFTVIQKSEAYTYLEFYPRTGRTHQLRVHAADPRGLGTPILGDRLYGCQAEVDRLHLHARELHFQHPHRGETWHLQVLQSR